MKKQKSPVILVVVISALAIGGVYVSQKAKEETMNPEERMKLEMSRQQQKATEGKRKTGSAAEMAELAAKSTEDVKPVNPREQMMKMKKEMGGPMANRPSIERITPTTSKPVPNDSSISSQWYTPESAKSK